MTDTAKNLEAETIVFDANAANQTVTHRWEPKRGDETYALKAYLLEKKKIDAAGAEELVDQAVDILACCAPPDGPDTQEIGLVLGRVQSGKTMSFTMVSALARDNGYRIVVVLTGVSTPLLGQSTKRLTQDLRLNDDQGEPNRVWYGIVNPSLSRDYQNIENALETWRDPKARNLQRRTLLITVMKNVTHMIKFKNVLLELGDKLHGVPVLIIDDEADQASMNNFVKEQRQSSTYREILNIRSSIPHHSYLQYTATPQAPLLINVIDTLSPNFAQVLSPGEAYTGGETFFVKERNNLIITLPKDELPKANELPDTPPESLQEAMRFFFIGVAAGISIAYKKGLKGPSGNRSMMVHPAVTKESHKIYCSWVRKLSDTWRFLLELPEADLDRQELLGEFKKQYDELARTVPSLPCFEELADQLVFAIRSTPIEEINTRVSNTPEIKWYEHYSWILVGGTALDRGFTVEGLTVTYMPRGGGIGNADTIQQRARFFGYKRSYLGYCRVYLPKALAEQFTSYVEHEEDVRERLIAHMSSNRVLKEWKRAFLLENTLKPTRTSVLNLEYMHVNLFKTWWTPKSPHHPKDAIEANHVLVEEFRRNLAFEPLTDKSYKDFTEEQKHLVATTTLRHAYETLLLDLRWGNPADSMIYTGFLIQLKNYLEKNPNEYCTIYLMSRGKPRNRGLTEKDEIKNLFQGKNPHTEYPSDKGFKAKDELTIQLHLLNLKRDAAHTPLEVDEDLASHEQAAINNVYTIAIHAPKKMHAAYVQEENGEK